MARGNEKIDRKSLANILNDYTQKRPNLLGRSTFHVNVESTDETFRDDRYNEVRVNLLTPAGRFYASAEAIDEEMALKGALEKIDRQVERKLDLSNMFNQKSFEGGSEEVR
jgi:hypothetical protein